MAKDAAKFEIHKSLKSRIRNDENMSDRNIVPSGGMTPSVV
jgi:hypothetical protein|tara:strand:- start:2564 stop:2686 length:123 start_codon:yes stop_codon:yes gene_type:complete